MYVLSLNCFGSFLINDKWHSCIKLICISTHIFECFCKISFRLYKHIFHLCELTCILLFFCVLYGRFLNEAEYDGLTSGAMCLCVISEQYWNGVICMTVLNTQAHELEICYKIWRNV